MEQSQFTSKAQSQRECQPDANPWSSDQPQSTLYKPLCTHLLEEDHESERRVIDPEGYTAQTQESEMSEEDLHKKRFYGIEPPKTYNKTFGSIKDFLSFFENRGPEIKRFATIFKEVEASQDLKRLNKDILPIIADSIKEESTKVTDEKGKRRTIKLFKRTLDSFHEFYSAILKAYTIEGFLYLNMNHYLRTEDWTQLHCLLPYAFCLFKAFLQSELASACNGQQKQPAKDGKDPEKLILYRGMRLDEDSLGFYEPQIASNFSWISVTSTSTNREIAEKFMKSNVDDDKVPVMFIIEVPLNSDNIESTRWLDIKSFSVYPTEDEIILCPGSTFQLVDVCRDKDEAEVQLRLISDVGTLAYQGQIMHGTMNAEMTMGTVCKVVCLEEYELTEAISHLRGNQLIEELEFTLCRFDKDALEKLVETILTLPKLVKFAFTSVSSKDKTHLDIILKVLDQKGIQSLEISDQLLEDQQYMILFAQGVKHLTSLKALTLNFRGSEYFTDEILMSLCSHGLKHLTSLTALTLQFAHCSRITNEGVKSLCSDGLKHLTSLTALTLDFEWCTKIRDKEIKSLCSDGLKHLTSLTTLTLNSSGTGDEGVESLCSHGLKHMTSLTALNLNFGICLVISDEGVKNLCSNGLKHLTSLTTLSLKFTSSVRITNKGVKILCSDGLKYLTSLTALTLQIAYSLKVTNEGVKSLCSDGLKHLTSLTTLSLNFEACNYVTHEAKKAIMSWIDKVKNTFIKSDEKSNEVDIHRAYKSKREKKNQGQSLYIETAPDSVSIASPNSTDKQQTLYAKLLEDGQISYSGNASWMSDNELISRKSGDMKQLASLQVLTLYLRDNGTPGDDIVTRNIRNLISLTALTLNFGQFRQITDEEVKSLCSDGLKHLTSLTTLIINFEHCWKITDKGVKSLCSDGLKYMTSLTTLNLNLAWCGTITDQGMKSLGSDGLKHLTSLTTLSLNFKRCFETTDEGVKTLCSDGLKHLISLTALTLKLRECKNITDEVVKSLCSDGLKHMTSLTTLNLNFACCDNITDQGVKSLCSDGLKHLTSLTTLSLNFEYCSKTTDEGVKALCSDGFKHLNSLTALTLKFRECRNFTDEVVKSLCSDGLKHLTSLTALTFSFVGFSEITDEAVKSLWSDGLKHLTSLTALTLDLTSCENITDEGVKSLCSDGLKYLTLLTTLRFNFQNCPKISNAGFLNIIKLLKYFGFYPNNS